MIKRLLAVRLRGAFLSAVGGKDKKGNPQSVSGAKIAGYAFIYAFLALVFLALVFTFAAPLAMILIPMGAESMYFGIFMLLSLSVIFIFSIFETKTELYECKDNELLLSMPILPRDIVISRIFTVLIYNYIEALVIFIPVLVCYLIFGGGAVGVIGLIFVFTTVPLVATVLASGVGYAVHLISYKLGRYKNIIIMILSVGFLTLYVVGYTSLMSSFEGVFEDLENNFQSIAEKYSLLSVIGSVALFKPLPLIIYTLAVAGLTLIAVVVISRKYMSLVTSGIKTQKSVYVARELKSRSAFASLTKKEFARLLSSPAYMLNGALGFLMQVVVAVLIVIMGPQLINADPAVLAELGITEAAITNMSIPLFIAILVFTCAVNMLSCSALSLEGKNLWILKSMPISAKTVLFAKATPQILLSVVFSILSGLIAGIGVGASFINVLFFILIPMVFGVFSSLVGVIFNVLFPKFDFVNEVQVIKQSTAVFLTLMINMLMSVIVVAGAFVSMSVKYPSLILLAIFALISAVCILLYFVIRGPIARRYSEF